MKPKPLLIIQHQYQAPNKWKRFVAILCFMEFYTQFVLHGQSIRGCIYEIKWAYQKNKDLVFSDDLIEKIFTNHDLDTLIWLNGMQYQVQDR